MDFRTAMVYSDNRWVSVLLTTDGSGTADVDVGVEVVAENGDSATIDCGTIESNAGVECQFQLDADWFGSEEQEVEVVAFIYDTNFTSDAQSLAVAAALNDPSELGEASAVFLQLPSYPSLAGAMAETPLFACTDDADIGSFQLATWVIAVTLSSVEGTKDADLNNSIAVAVVESDLYDVLYDTAGNVVTLVGTKKSTVTNLTRLASATSSDNKLALATITWEVASNATAVGFESVLVDDLVSTFSNKVVDNEAGYFVVEGDATTSSVELDVEPAYTVALQAQVDEDDLQELANVAALGQPAQKTVAAVYRVLSCHSLGSDGDCLEPKSRVLLKDGTDALTCTSSDANAMTVTTKSQSSCQATLDGSETTGGDVTMDVAYEDSDGNEFSTEVWFRIWFPTATVLEVDDVELDEVTTLAGASLEPELFQSTKVALTTKFAVGLDFVTPRVDVSRLVSFNSSNTDVATIAETSLHGVYPGKTVVSCGSCAVDVSDVDVSVLGTSSVTVVLTPIVVTDIASLEVDDLVDVNAERLDQGLSANKPFYSADSAAVLKQQFTAEGDNGFIYAYLQYSDGNTFLLENNTNLALTVTSGPVNLTVVEDSTPFFELVVPTGGGSQEGLFGTLEYHVEDTAVAEADIYLTVEKPDIDYVTLETSADVIYPPLDTMAKAPFNLADRAVLTATVVYLDGSEQDFSTDSRATYTSNDDVVAESESEAGVFVVVEPKGSDVVRNSVKLTVNIDGFKASVNIAVDIADSMAVVPNSSPACTLSGCSNKLTYRKIQLTTAVFQRFKLTASVTTALGDTYDLPLSRANVKLDTAAFEVFGGTSCASRRRSLANATNATAPAPSPFDQACDDMSATDCCDTEGDVEKYDVGFLSTFSGRTDILVTFRDYFAELELVTKATVPARVSAVAITKPTGVVSTNLTIAADTTFDDLTKFNTADSFYGVSNFLRFSTSDDKVLDVTSDGVLEPVANSVYGEYVDFTVKNVANTASDTETVLVNLDPVVGDADVGGTDGFQFGDFADASVGDTVEVAVRFNSGSRPLAGFQIQLFFDSDVLQAVDVANGADWEPSVTATLGSPSSMVQILSSAPTSTAKGTLELAVVTFRVVAVSGDTALTGTIVETLTSNGVHIGADNRAMVAGVGLVTFESRRGRRVLEQQQRMVVAATAARHRTAASLAPRRSLQECTATEGVDCLRGDINADCRFTLSDLDFLIRYITGADVDFDDEDYQLAMMDADLDGDVDGVDINFITYALAKKYLFLLEPPVVTISQCSINVSLSLCDSESKIVRNGTYVRVAVELGNTDRDVGVEAVLDGTYANETDDGILIAAAGPATDTANASYTVAVAMNATDTPYGVGVVVLVETLADTGVEDNLRKFPWRGSSFGFYGESGFSFDPLVEVEFGCTCDENCIEPGLFKQGCAANGSDLGDSECVVCSNDEVNLYPVTNGGVEDACDFELCPAGFRCNFSSTSLHPVECEPGTFQNEEGGTACKECGLGRFQPDSGKSECVTCSNDCADGWYTKGCNGTANGTCAPCTPHPGYLFVGSGFWNDTCLLEEVAADCPVGQYKFTEDFFNYTCKECDEPAAGEYVTDQGGFYHKCPTEPCDVGCNIGFYRSGCGGTNAGKCVDCSDPENGTYIVGDGDMRDDCEANRCAVDSCDVGYFLDGCEGTSQGTCEECTELDDGYFVGNGGVSDDCDVQECVDCPTGEYLAGCGGTSAGTCKQCTREAGFRIVAAEGLREDVCETVECAEDCGTGFYRSGCGGTNNGTCVACSAAPFGFVITGDGGLEDDCDMDECAADCPVGYFNNDCGNMSNPEGTCVPCSDPPPGFYLTGDGNFTDTCPTAACNPDRCSNSQYLAGCGGVSRGTCVTCSSTGHGKYWSKGGGLRDACNAQNCPANCGVGKFRNGCEGHTSLGQCDECTNAPTGAIYTTDGGLANACDFTECEPTCPAGQYVVNCTEDDNLCADCTNVGASVCMRNGADAGTEFAYAVGSTNQEIALRACESENGANNCELGRCGGFEYYYKFTDGHCDCGKAVGTVEWVFANRFRANYCDADYRSGGDADGLAGDKLFTRVRTAAMCNGKASWEVLDADLGTPTSTETAAASRDCGGFYYAGDGDFDDACPTEMCNVNCAPHQYNSGCEGTSAGECTNCSAIPDGYHYFKDGDLADECLSAKCVDDCDDGFFLDGCYSGPGSCEACSPPQEGFYLSSNGNMSDSCTATECTASCPAGQFMLGSCPGVNNNTDFECTPCLTCSIGLVANTTCDGTTYKDVTECVSPTFHRKALGSNNKFDPVNYSFVLFGANNTAYGNEIFVAAGADNMVSSVADLGPGGSSAVFGGHFNLVDGGSSIDVGGTENCVGGERSLLMGGRDNSMACSDGVGGATSVMAGGESNLLDGRNCGVGSGLKNKITTNGDFSVIAGGWKNSVANDYAVILGGRSGKSVSNYASVLGGFAGKANGRFSTVVGGSRCTANGKFALSGGFQSRAASVRSMVMGFDKSKFCRSIGASSINFCTQSGFYINDMELSQLVSDANRRLSDNPAASGEDLDELHAVIAEQAASIDHKRKELLSLRQRLKYLSAHAARGRQRRSASE